MAVSPEEFVRMLEGASEGDVLRYWGRASKHHCLTRTTSIVVAAAHAALDDFIAQARDTQLSPAVDQAVQGALFTVVQRIRECPNSAYQDCRDLSRYFDSSNASIAFISIRQFELYLASYTGFVTDRLVAVASGPPRNPVPCPMTVRGIAFAILYSLSPQYKRWPELVDARNECIRGCLAWASQGGGDRADHYRDLAHGISRYLHSGA